MSNSLLSRKPVKTLVINMATTTLTAGSWVQIITAANMLYAATALEIWNGSGSPIEIGTGAAGVEVSTNYTCPPGGAIQIIAHPFKSGVRVAAKANTNTPAAGFLILNFFG